MKFNHIGICYSYTNNKFWFIKAYLGYLCYLCCLEKMNTFNNFNNLKLKPLTFNFNHLNHLNHLKHFHNFCNDFSINVPKMVQISLTNTNDYFNDLYSRIPYHSQR